MAATLVMAVAMAGLRQNRRRSLLVASLVSLDILFSLQFEI
jgi:hypothetical protein